MKKKRKIIYRDYNEKRLAEAMKTSEFEEVLYQIATNWKGRGGK